MHGIVDDPEYRAMRQMPSVSLPWMYTLWVSEVGVVRPRYYDVVDQDWKWGDIRLPVLNGHGRMGFHVHGTFRTIEQTIALAWLPRSTPTARIRPIELLDGEELVAHNMRWKDEVESDSDCSSDSSKQWLPLRFKIGVVTCDFPDYKLSRCGCIKTPHGTTEGSYAIGCSKFGILPQIGLVNLEKVVRLLDNGRGDRPPPRFSRVLRHIRKGRSIRDIARRECIKESTAWAYAYAGLRHVSTDTARALTHRCLSENVAVAMECLLEEVPNVVLVGRLHELVYMLTKLLSADTDWKTNPHRYAETLMMRSVLQREYCAKRP
jgi:hypothetical protein